MLGDLHCHSRLSDGSMGLDDLVFYAKRAGLDFIALTDHDTMDGISRSSVLGKRYGVNVLAGTEISCIDGETGRKAHLLCYLPDKPDRLQGMLNQTLESRTKAGIRMIRGVMRYYPVTEEHIQRHATGSRSIYKIHIMQALIDLGYDKEPYGTLFSELFSEKSGLCTENPEYPEIRAAAELVRSAGGIAVLAHPPVYDSMALLERLAKSGEIQGVENFHPRISAEQEAQIAEIAERYGLLRTGGSDFHGAYRKYPVPLASRITDDAALSALLNHKKQMNRGR